MPRDMDLIRDLMLRFERGDISVPLGHTKVDVAYHVNQLVDEGYIKGTVIKGPLPGTGKSIPLAYIVDDITWKGHDFIKAVRDDVLWHRVKEHFAKKVVPFTADLILTFVKSEGLKAIGM